MKSFTGKMAAWNTTNSNQYITYAPIEKEEGEPVPVWCATKEIAWNIFFDNFLKNIERNAGKNIYWRKHPICNVRLFSSEYDESTPLYFVSARYCFE